MSTQEYRLNKAFLIWYSQNMESTNSTTPSYIEDKEALNKRLKRAEGQIRGIQKMVDEERYCIDILTQIGAVQSALDKVALSLLENHAGHCVIEASQDQQAEKVREMMASVKRLLHHG